MTEKAKLINNYKSQSFEIEGELPDGFIGNKEGERWVCPKNAQNAQALRRHYPWTAPALVGLKKSVGCGDRLGLATPGHLQAVQESDLFPVLAQQSIREMERANRTPRQVMDDVTWAVFDSDYREGFGCDADHLKNTNVIDEAIAAGFIGFTLDPSEHVDGDAQTDTLETLEEKYAALNWDGLDITPEVLMQRYSGNSPVGEVTTVDIYRAACKYGNALAYTALMARHIHDKLGADNYDLEVSVDETETPTSPIEHYFIAAELQRMGITFHGLAPRFIGRFEKGVDYIGDLDAFEVDFEQHARIAKELGPYKLSIHSGSDKFSIYPIIAQYANPYIHLKTAGTSWLEALRVIARYDVPLMREMVNLAVEQYPKDRASYHVSAEVEKLPEVPEQQLETLLDDFHARQIMHVTFGTLLNQFHEPFYIVLNNHLDAYHTLLKAHFGRHIQPFAGEAQA